MWSRGVAGDVLVALGKAVPCGSSGQTEESQERKESERRESRERRPSAPVYGSEEPVEMAWGRTWPCGSGSEVEGGPDEIFGRDATSELALKVC